MATRYSPQFGELVVKLLERRGLSYTQASIRTMGTVSPSYWGEMRRGRVPSYAILATIRDVFSDEDLTELFEAAGYPPPTPPPSDDSLPPELIPLNRNDTARFPMPPGVSASEFGNDEPFGGKGVGFTLEALAQGAEYAYVVTGDCLNPHIKRGDWVAVKLTDRPSEGDVALISHNAQLTLKVWRRRTEGVWLGTADEEAHPGFALEKARHKVIGVVVATHRSGKPDIPVKPRKKKAPLAGTPEAFPSKEGRGRP